LYGLGPNGKDDGGHGLYMTAIPEGGEDEARPEGSDDVGFRIAGSVPEKPKTVRVAAIQFISRFAKPAENRKGLEPLIREAAKNGAKIVVLPETAISAYASTDLKTTWQLPGWKMTEGLKGVSPKDVAETVPGESTRVFGALAKELGIYLTVPFVEVDPKQDKYFNTIVLVGPDGRMLLHYRKLNPWPWAERGWATKGDRGHQFIDTPYGRLGLLVCYDINFEPPTLKKNRVDHLLYCIAWVDLPRSDWFPKRLPEIARKNDINIIGANWSVPEPQPWHGWGHTLILSREGKTLATVNNDVGNEIIYADLPVPGKRESGDRSQESGEVESRLSLRESSAARLSRSERRQYIKHQSRSYHNVRQRAPS
jgi:predicted amidohydrolase